MKNNKKGFTLIELISVILILSIVSLIAIAVKVNLDKSTKAAYYKSLEGTVSLSGQKYFSDHLEERPVDTDFASVIEINGLNSPKNLESKSYISTVYDVNKNECPGRVITYMNVDKEYTYVACLECQDYNSVDNNRICDCEVIPTIDEETGEEYRTCQLSEISTPSVTTVKINDNDTEIGPYTSYGEGEEVFTYDNAIWIKEGIRVSYTTDYEYAKKIRVLDEEGKMVDSMSCNLTGTGTEKSCTKNIKATTYGTYTAYVVDDLNRISTTKGKEFYIKIDKTTPQIGITAYDTIGGVYGSGTSTRNLDLQLTTRDPKIAPSGYTYQWYYSTDLVNGNSTNGVLITEMKVIPVGENIIEVKEEVEGEGEGEGDGSEEITDKDTNVGYFFDKTNQSLFVNATREVSISRRYIIKVTTGAGISTTDEENLNMKNVTINRPAAKVTLTAKKASSGTALTSNSWSNEDVVLTANISDSNYRVIRWTKTPNVEGGVPTNIQITSTTYNVTSMSNNSGDKYTAIVALSDNTDQEESEGFIVKIDKTAPSCGSVSGSSTSWTSSSRSISVKCSDTISGCAAATYYKTFSSTAKTGSISIKDKAGNTKSCSVNVYVDKTAPSVTVSKFNCGGTPNICTFKASASDGNSGLSYLKRSTNGGSYATVTNGSQYEAPASYSMCAYAVDKVGNQSSTKCV